MISRTNLNTAFASAEKAESTKLHDQAVVVATEMGKNHVLDAISDILTILNEYRQVVYANARLYDFLGVSSEDVIGKRPGELLDCVHASQTDGGCGTTEFCRECGAVNAVLEAQGNKQSIKECHILTKKGKALDLQIWATPITLSGKLFTVFSIKDISHEKRRAALERTFFHDILNTAGNIMTASELLQDDVMEEDKEYFLHLIYQGSEQLVDEINSQRQILAAETGSLKPNLQMVDPLDILRKIVIVFQVSKEAEGKQITVSSTSSSTIIATDKTILGRIISNLLKNALEASGPGMKVTLGCKQEANGVQISVHNAGEMPRSTQLQIFKRSFTTKGTGRGIGTYSIKLFTEHYLGGKTWFESTEDAGTTFFVFLPIQQIPQ